MDTENRIRSAFQALPPLLHEGQHRSDRNVCMPSSTGRAPLVTPREGRDTIELITAIYKSGSTGLPVSLRSDRMIPGTHCRDILAGAIRFHEKKASVTRLGDGNITV